MKKGDLRFVFLSPEHAFHDYYTQKLSLYTDMHRELKAKQSETSSQLVENKRETRGESPAERSVVDPELMKTERRKKAALFLDQMRKDRVVGTVVLPCELLQRLQRDVFFISQGKESIDETESAEIGSTSSSAKKSKSGSPDDVDVEIILSMWT